MMQVYLTDLINDYFNVAKMNNNNSIINSLAPHVRPSMSLPKLRLSTPY